MDSPPPTPPASSGHPQRFVDIRLPCEWIEDYRPGGMHPVHIGDEFKSEQYGIVRKLGEGSYSTVWLARDVRNNRYVAIKIVVAQSSRPTREAEILHQLFTSNKKKAQVQGSEQENLTQLLDKFQHYGPNGTHNCFVFEAMGPNANVMLEELLPYDSQNIHEIRWPFWMAKRILKQVLQGLVYLHANGVAHGGLQPGNILFPLCDGIDTQPEEALRQALDVESRSISPPVRRLDGKQDQWAPQYLCVAQPLSEHANTSENFRVKLSDLGGAYFLSAPPTQLVTPTALRTPEYVLNKVVHPSADIWAFGCLVFELVAGRPLIEVWGSKCQGDQYALSVAERLGDLPDELYTQWKTNSLYYTSERVLFNCQLGGVPEGGEPLVLERVSMEEAVDREAIELDEAHKEALKNLLRCILQYDPEERPSAEDLLQYPFFN